MECSKPCTSKTLYVSVEVREYAVQTPEEGKHQTERTVNTKALRRKFLQSDLGGIGVRDDFRGVKGRQIV